MSIPRWVPSMPTLLYRPDTRSSRSLLTRVRLPPTQGVLDGLLEGHRLPLGPCLLEAHLAKPRTYGGPGAFVYRAVGFVIDVDGHPDRFVQSFGRTDEAPTALRLTPRFSYHGKPLQAVGGVRPVSDLLRKGNRFLKERCGPVVIAAGEGYLRQVVERDVGAGPVSYPAGHCQPLLKRLCCSVLLTAR